MRNIDYVEFESGRTSDLFEYFKRLVAEATARLRIELHDRHRCCQTLAGTITESDSNPTVRSDSIHN